MPVVNKEYIELILPWSRRRPYLHCAAAAEKINRRAERRRRRFCVSTPAWIGGSSKFRHYNKATEINEDSEKFSLARTSHSPYRNFERQSTYCPMISSSTMGDSESHTSADSNTAETDDSTSRSWKKGQTFCQNMWRRHRLARTISSSPIKCLTDAPDNIL